MGVPATADLYQWTDTNGIIHIVDEADTVPDAYRKKVKVYRGTKSVVSESPSAIALSPSRIYAEHSQGAFAQQLALDLGLIGSSAQDALGPLSGVGIRPAGGWKVHDALTPEVLYEVLAAARRAADAKRIALSADAIEAVVRQAAAPFLAVPPVAQAPVAGWEESEEPGYYEEQPEIIIEQPPLEVIEVIHEPYYVPVIVNAPHFHHRRHHSRGHRRNRHGQDESRLSPSLQQPRSIRRGLTPLPFAASPPLPMGASSRMRFGSSPPARGGMSRGR